MTSCTQLRKDGKPCKASPKPGESVCRWHSQSPEDRARHIEESRRGGLTKAYGNLESVSALSEIEGVRDLDLSTAGGLTSFLAATLGNLARLPFDARIANSIGNLSNAQRSLIEASDFERRIAALEEKQKLINRNN